MRAAAAWTAFALVAVALDGPVGGIVPVIVAAVLLARIQIRAIAALGVVALALAPITVLWGGLPAADEVSPRFVLDNMPAHHLTFAGLLLVGTWAVLDMWPAMHARAKGAQEVPPTPVDQPPNPPLVVGIVVVAAVAALMFVLCQAVLGA
ncbi:MAG: hypothetical protein U0P45_08795 [Acidimicrobiales bacterium]